MFAPDLASRGVTVAEFNVEKTPATGTFSSVDFNVLTASTQPGRPSVGRRNEYQRKLGRKQAHCAMQ